MNICVTDLRPGDVITTDADDVTVEAIEPVLNSPAGGPATGPEMVRIFGRITRGTGRSNKTLTWTKHADQHVDIHRPGSGEQVFHFDRNGRPRRVR